tara:strand:+ start:534 stop:1367 length:834 start_codon:yes stop_codon:yes gene_type:complete
MALQTLNIGTAANDGTGDNLRVGGDKINDNFSEIYTAFGNGSSLSSLAVTALNGATANELVTVGATTTELDAEGNLTFDGSTLAVTGAVTVSGLTTLSGNLVIPNAGNIGSAGDTDAIAIASGGAVTFSQRDVHSSGITIADGGEIGSASDTDAITISAAGVATFSQRDVHSSGITVADGGQIGSASDADAITIASGGGVTFSQTSIHSASLSVKNGATSAGFIEFFEDSDNGTNKVTLIGPASTGDVTLTLGSTAGTIATTADIAGEATALAIALG